MSIRTFVSLLLPPSTEAPGPFRWHFANAESDQVAYDQACWWDWLACPLHSLASLGNLSRPWGNAAHRRAIKIECIVLREMGLLEDQVLPVFLAYVEEWGDGSMRWDRGDFAAFFAELRRFPAVPPSGGSVGTQNAKHCLVNL